MSAGHRSLVRLLGALALLAAGCSQGRPGDAASPADPGGALADPSGGGDGEAPLPDGASSDPAGSWDDGATGPLTCDTGNPCTLAMRALEGGCVYRLLPDDTPCPGDGDPCTWDVCRAGRCGVARSWALRAFPVPQAQILPDGGYVSIAGRRFDGWIAPDGGRIMRFDGLGRVRWVTHAVDFESAFPPSSLSLTPDGAGLLVAGFVYTNPAGYGDDPISYVARLDLDGAVMWVRRYPPEGFSTLYWVHALEDGGFLAAGYAPREGCPVYSGCPWLSRVDASGQPLWLHTPETSGAMEPPAATGSGVAYAVVQGPATGDPQDRPFVVRLDAEGEILWTRRITEAYAWHPWALGATPGGGLILVGKAGGSRFFAVKLPPDGGEAVWSTPISKDPTFWQGGPIHKWAEFRSAGFLADGGLIVQGNIGNDGPWLARVDGQGETLWEHLWAIPYTQGDYGLPIENGYLMFGGTYDHNLEPGAWWQILDADGLACPDPEEGDEAAPPP
jgi:hypothetical protein